MPASFPHFLKLPGLFPSLKDDSLSRAADGGVIWNGIPFQTPQAVGSKQKARIPKASAAIHDSPFRTHKSDYYTSL